MYTKGKWVFDEDRNCFTIRSEFGKPIADMWHNGDSAEANAARIVQCVNSHDELVAALEHYMSAFTPESNNEYKSWDGVAIYDNAKEVLKNAKA